MKKLLLLFIYLTSYCTIAQSGYPIPDSNPNRLFYIQHSNNHNTYVYDVDINKGLLDSSEPIVAYRIIYTRGGIKADLTGLQRRLAYGVTFKKIADKSCTFTLAAYPEKEFFLRIAEKGKAYVMVSVNGKNLILKRMFLFSNKTGTKVDCINFYGKDIKTGRDVVEKFYP